MSAGRFFAKRPLPAVLLGSMTLGFGTYSIEPLAQSVRTLEEVVVTAQKRETSLQKTPIAVSAFDHQSIENFGIGDVRDIGSIVPNMSVTEISSNATTVTISMRGSSTGNPAPYWEPTVGIYLNNVFIGKTVGGIFDLLDVERIEVLRGPQGTLYGKNTLSGAVNYITRKPSGELSGDLRLGAGNYDLQSAYGSVDLPRLETGIGSLSANIAATIKKRGDLYDNTPDPLNNATGLTSSHAPSSSGFKSIDSRGFRASLLWDVSDDIAVLYEYHSQDIDQTPPLAQLTSIEPGGGAYPGPILDGYLTSPRKRARKASNDYSISEQAESQAHALHVDWQLGELGFLGDVTLKSISSYRKLDTNDAQDLDGSPIDLFHFRRIFEYEQASQEFQLIGTTERTDYILGLYYFEEEGDVINPITFFGAFGSPTSLNQYGLDNSSYAMFGQAEIRLTERLALTVGGRYTKEKKQQYIDRPTFQYTSASETWSNFSPTLSLGYDLTDSANLYFRIARGWKSGGFNGEAQSVDAFLRDFDAETVTSYELGIKSRLFDDTLQVNATAFYSKNDDMQLSVFLGGSAAASVIANAGEAVTSGFEIELLGQLTDNLRVFLNYGYLDAEYRKFIDGGVDVKNERYFSYAPRNTLTAGLDWSLLHSSMGSLDLHIDWNFKDEYTPYVHPAQRAVAQMPSHRLLNARLSLSEIPIGENQLEISLWAKNIRNEEYPIMATPFGGWTVSTFGEPRTYGIDFAYTF